MQRIEEMRAWSQQSRVRAAQLLFPEHDAASMAVTGGLAAWFSRESVINYAAGLGMRGSVNDEHVRQIDDFYRSRGGSARIDVCPYADRGLPELLLSHGYEASGQTSVMIRELDTELEMPPLDGVKVESAHLSESEQWSRIVGLGFSDGAEITPDRVELGLMLFYQQEVTAYFARIGDEAAGGGALLVYRGLGALFASSVLPEYRRRGVHSALIRTRLQHAKEKQCDLAVFHALPVSPSYRNAERHGFHLLYTITEFTKSF